MQAAALAEDPRRSDELRAAGLEAAEKALSLDPRNSEALDRKTYLMKDPHDWLTQEKLYKASIAAKPLDCGCEHYGYGLMLEKVGRTRDAVEEQRAATNMLALWPDSQVALAEVLLASGSPDEARRHFDEAIDLTTDTSLKYWIASRQGTETRDYAAAITALRNPELEMAAETRAALVSGYQALASGDAAAMRNAVQRLLAVSPENRSSALAPMLAALGATRQALQFAGDNTRLFWRRSMRGVLNDPAFPAVAKQLGLMRYWSMSHSKPDVCLESEPPPFCRMI